VASKLIPGRRAGASIRFLAAGRTGLLVAVCLSVSYPAFAAEVIAPSKIDAVTVFPSGAEITRIVKIKLAAGEQTILLNDITGEALPTSLRVEASASSRLEIGSVDTRRISLASDDPAIASSARKRIDDQIEVLNDSRAAQDDIIEGAEMQRGYIENLAKLPQTPTAAAAAPASGQQEDWRTLFGVIGSSMTDTAKAIAAAKLRQREIDRQLEDLRKQLAVADNNGMERTEVRIYVSAAEALESELTVRYQISSASWSPFYDARLSTGDKTTGTAPALALTRRASVSQRTGEDWDGVRLALSTTRPGATTAAPELKTLAVDFADGAKLHAIAPASQSARKIDSMDQQFSRGLAQGSDHDLEENRAAQRPMQNAVARPAVATVTTFQAVYAIPGRTIIKSSGDAKRLQITAEDIKPTLMVQTTPRIDSTAYLYAHMALPTTASPLLQGQVSLFRDGVFVGNGQIPQLSPGESHDLGFGADERVKVKRAVLEDKKGESGTFTTSYVEERRYAITVKNYNNQDIQVQVVDRVPVPLHQDITVDFKVYQGPQPLENDVNDKRGVVVWQISAGPGEEKQIGYGYKLSATAGKPILYGEIGEEQEKLEMFFKAPIVRKKL
jgi:uncharacterized protein (TIGR02231 family)